MSGLVGASSGLVEVDCAPNGFAAGAAPKPDGPLDANALNPPPPPAVEVPNPDAPNALPVVPAVLAPNGWAVDAPKGWTVVVLAPNPPVVLVEAPNPPPAVDAPKPPPPVDAPNAEVAGAVEPNGLSRANALEAAGSGYANAGVPPWFAAAASAPNPEEPKVGAAELPNPPAPEVDAPKAVGFDANAANPPPPLVPPPAVDELKALVAGAADAPNPDEPNLPPGVDAPNAHSAIVLAPNPLCPNAGLAAAAPPNPDWPDAGAAVEVKAPNTDVVVEAPKGLAAPNAD